MAEITHPRTYPERLTALTQPTLARRITISQPTHTTSLVWKVFRQAQGIDLPGR
jgi:hypothetical protein